LKIINWNGDPVSQIKEVYDKNPNLKAYIERNLALDKFKTFLAEKRHQPISNL